MNVLDSNAVVNGAVPDFRDIYLLGERFEQQATLHPEAPALTLGSASLSYAELNARANRLAAHLRQLGVVPEALVAIHLDRSFDLIAGILAILKAGGAYLPLDLACPGDRLAFMVEDSGARVILTHSTLASRFAGCKGTVVNVDQLDLAPYSPENVPTTLRPDNLAYVIYTSGSTGQPKGVLVTHENVSRLFSATDAWFQFGPRDVWTLFHSYAFDFSVWEIFGALLHGGRLVIVPYDVSRSADAFHKLLVSERVTVLNQTPSAFRQLVRADGKGAKAPLSLRYIIFGGEALEFQILAPWFARYGDQQPKCINMYGITETTVHVTYRPVTRRDVEAGSGSNIGIPIPDLQVYVVNANGAKAGTDEVGEILVGGKGVARGYLNRPELTGERFVNNPFASNGSSRLYRTGDSARVLATGELEYLGRIDQQVKIRGFRIELTEIESVLARHSGVRECAVIARADNGSEARLVAYVAADPAAVPTIAALRNHLAAKLPEYMVPAVYVFLDSFPLTINGKLDRAGLPALSGERPRLEAKFVPPQDEMEETLAKIWRESLRLDQVGIDDNFFDLGGDSLSAMAMLAEAEKALGRPIGMLPLLEGGTIRVMAKAAREPGVAAPPPLMVCTQAGKGKTPLFFTHGDLDHGGTYCRNMAVLLGTDQPLYSLAPQGTLGSPLVDSFEEAAAQYIKLIHTIQPQGPYHLGGFCNGALAMYEVARQLTQSGQTVASLVLLDPPDLYFTFLRAITKVWTLLGLPERKIHNIYQRITEGFEVWVYHRTLRAQLDFWQKVFDWMVRRMLGKADDDPDAAAMLSLRFHYFHMLASYQPHSDLGTRTTWIMLRAEESHRIPQQIKYWSRMIKAARFEVIPGTHLELRDSMGKIADVLKSAMKKSA